MEMTLDEKYSASNQIKEAKEKSIPNGKFQHITTDTYHWIMTPNGIHGEEFYWKVPAKLFYEGKEYIAFTDWLAPKNNFYVGVFEIKKVD